MAGNLTAMIAAIFSGSAVSTDPYFNLTTLLLSTTATNGQQNNTFQDSSTNNFTITRNPATGPNAPTQGTFSPFSQTGWSGSFGNASSWITTNTTAFSTTASTWTIEAWVYMNALPTADPPPMFGDMQAGGITNWLSFGPDVNGKLQLYWYDGASRTAVGNTVMSLNTWNHVAVSVNAGAISLFVNGTLQTITGTSTLTNRGGTTGANVISRSYTAFFNAYISNLRVTTTAVYSGSFTPSTTPLTAITGTQLLLFTGNRFVDANTQTTPKTLTITTNSGYPAVVPFSPFNPTSAWSASTVGGSGYFDGTGDYLVAPSTANAAFAWGTGDYSIECWVYPIAAAYTRVFTSSVTANGSCDISSGGAVNYFDGTAYTIGTLSINQWTHLCITRKSGTLRTFKNGVMQYNGANSVNASSNANFGIAATAAGAQTGNLYIASVRMVKGGIPTAYDTSSTTNGTQIFTPPTSAFTGSESLTAGSVSLLLNFTNAGIYDATAKNVLETVGSAQVSTTTSQWPSTSMSFNGTTDYLQVNTASDLYNLSSGNWTIEAWVYRTGTQQMSPISYLNGSGTTLNGWAIEVNRTSAGTLYWASYNASTGPSGSASSAGNLIPLNVWTYIAVTCVGTTITLYVNGASVVTGTRGTIGNDSSCRLRIGGMNYTTVRYWQGYIQDPRITKGFARTIATPTAAFPVQ